MKHKLILAGTYEEFLEYIGGERLNDIAQGETHYFYGGSYYQLLKLKGQFDETKIIGTFWDRADAKELERLGKLRVV